MFFHIVPTLTYYSEKAQLSHNPSAIPVWPYPSRPKKKPKKFPLFWPKTQFVNVKKNILKKVKKNILKKV